MEELEEGRRWREELGPPRWPEWRIKRWGKQKRRRRRTNRRSGTSQATRLLWQWGQSPERAWAIWHWAGEVEMELEQRDWQAAKEQLARRRRISGGRSWAMAVAAAAAVAEAAAKAAAESGAEEEAEEEEEWVWID